MKSAQSAALRRPVRPRRRLAVGKKKLNRSRAANAFIFLFLLAGAVFMDIPLVYTFVNAFKPLEEFFVFPPRFYVIHPTLENFSDLSKLLSNMWVPLSRYLFNSVFVSAVATVGCIVFTVMAAFVITKHDIPGKKLIDFLIVNAILFTGKVIGVPQYIVLSSMNWIDSFMALLAPMLCMPLGMFLIRQFMDMVPDEIIESGRIDGAGELRICWKIVAPMVRPAVITVSIFVFQSILNYSSSTAFIYTESLKTLPNVLSQVSNGTMARAGVEAVAALIILLPPILFFIIFQRRIIETMSSSGIKG